MFHCYYCTDTHEKVCVFKLILNMKAQNYASSKHFLLLKLNMYHEIISYIHTHVYMHKISCYYLTHTYTPENHHKREDKVKFKRFSYRFVVIVVFFFFITKKRHDYMCVYTKHKFKCSCLLVTKYIK